MIEDNNRNTKIRRSYRRTGAVITNETRGFWAGGKWTTVPVWGSEIVSLEPSRTAMLCSAPRLSSPSDRRCGRHTSPPAGERTYFHRGRPQYWPGWKSWVCSVSASSQRRGSSTRSRPHPVETVYRRYIYRARLSHILCKVISYISLAQILHLIHCNTLCVENY